VKRIIAYGAHHRAVPMASILEGTTCRRMACRIHDLDEVGSTNAVAADLAREGAPEGTVVLARCQTSGKGRSGRSWSSPEGGLYLSVILRPDVALSQVTVLPILASLAVSKAISTSTGMVSSVKWPNDVLIGTRKVCGILSESTIMGERIEFLILGIGLNVNTLPDDLPPGSVATSLRTELGRQVDIGEVARDLMYMLDMLYSRFLDGQSEAILAEWTDRSSTIGSDVVVNTSHGNVEGKAMGLDGSGALILKQGPRLVRIDHGDCMNLR